MLTSPQAAADSSLQEEHSGSTGREEGDQPPQQFDQKSTALRPTVFPIPQSCGGSWEPQPRLLFLFLKETKLISLGVKKAALRKPHLVLGLGIGGSKRTALLWSELASVLRGPSEAVV